MSGIPVEILHKSFLYLNQAQKVECMLVCRHWAHTIQTLSLFETVRISSENSLTKFIDIVKVQPEQGALVKRLLLDVFFGNEDIANLIPTSFPCLQELFVFDHARYLYSKEISNVAWNNSIKVLVDYSSSRLTINLLASSTYPQLETLYINNRHFVGADIVPLFVNTPALTELYITEFRAGIADYELLHQHLPSLCKLTICEGDITSSRLLTEEIQPLKNLKSLTITYVDIEEEEHHRKFLQYIGKKYTNVTELILLINCQGIRLGHGYDQHQNDWSPILTSIQPQLKKIGIEAYAIPDNFFSILDHAGCHIEDLIIHSVCIMELSKKLIQSQQSKFIQKLVIDYTIEGVTTFEYLKELKSLKSLAVNYSSYPPPPFALNEILEACPDSVECFSTSNCYLKCNPKEERVYTLKELEFDGCKIPKNFDNFISKLMPHVKKMNFTKCKFTKRILELPDHELDEFQLISCLPNIATLLLETVDDKKKQWHCAESRLNVLYKYKNIFKIHDYLAYPAVKVIPFDEMSLKSYVGLTCRSLRNLVVIGRPHFD